MRNDNLTSYERMKRYGKFGFAFEKDFEGFVREDLGLNIERGDSKNKRNPDFLVTFRVDTKRRKSPLLKAKTFVGIDPDKCVALDMDKINAYIATGYNVLILFDVDYSPQFETRGLFIISIREIQALIENNPKRKKTFFDYEKKKEIERFYISTDEMKPFELFAVCFGVDEKHLTDRAS